MSKRGLPFALFGIAILLLVIAVLVYAGGRV
jgi:hypothetical protein